MAVLAARGEVRLAFCWSHVRRPFYELAQSGPAPIATEALTRIAALYRIEADIRGRSADERHALRQEHSRPLVEALQPWLHEKLSLISQKTKLAEAIRYTLSRWTGLCLFLEDGRVEIDNNAVERAIRPLALNRKNALFAGSDGGAEALGGDRFADRNVQAPRRRTARLPRRRHHPHRQRPSPKPPRRSPALGLSRNATAQGRGLRTTLTTTQAWGGGVIATSLKPD